MGGSYDYDVMVIGAGIAGFVSAVTVNSLGRRVAIVEKRKLGGNCTNFTCIPSKTLIRLSHVSREMSALDPFRGQDVPAIMLSNPRVMDRIRSVTDRVFAKDLPETFEKIGIPILEGTAQFIDRNHIDVNGRRFSSRKFIIAVGTRPLVLPIPGLRDIDYLTNENLYELETLPRSILILGGGVDGFEYASAFGRLGVRTTVVEMTARLMPTVDREIVNTLLRILRADGIRFLTGAKAVNVSREKEGVVLTYEQGEGKYGEVKAERVLVTIGRKPDIDQLMLEKAGIAYNQRGIQADASLRTTAPNIYACGDIVGPYQLASMAEYQGILAANNAVLPFKRKVNYDNNVYVTFTDPPFAQIGLTEEQAHREQAGKIKVYRIDYENMRRAIVDGTEAGIAKFICDHKGLLLGVHILGEGAPDVIHEAQIIRAVGKPLHRFHGVIHAYPTYAQALVGRASQLAFLGRMAGNSAVKAALTLLPGCSNRLALARDRLAETEPVRHEDGRDKSEALFPAEPFMAGRGCIIRLPRELTDYDEHSLLSACRFACGEIDPSELVLDFTLVRQLDPLGVFMLIKLAATSQRTGRKLKAFGLGPDLRDVFRITELEQVVALYESGDDALSGRTGPAKKADREAAEESPLSDKISWAKPISALKISSKPKQARGLNVAGLRPVGPVNGFGQLWQKIYRLHIDDPEISPEQAILALKQGFPVFQPHFNRFYPPPSGLKPGETVLFDSMTPGGPVSSGVLVLFADARSFTFMTPQGHPESGMIHFGAYRAKEKTIVQIVGLARANDPVYEAAFRLIGSKMQVRIWVHMLASLAADLGVPASITTEALCVDQRMKWRQGFNLLYNAQIRTLLLEPLWLLRAPFRGLREKS